jgi:excisionase family DNA binding protein
MTDFRTTVLLTPKEAAERLRLSRRHIYRLLKANEIIALRTGKKIVIPESSIQLFLTNKTHRP